MNKKIRKLLVMFFLFLTTVMFPWTSYGSLPPISAPMEKVYPLQISENDLSDERPEITEAFGEESEMPLRIRGIVLVGHEWDVVKSDLELFEGVQVKNLKIPSKIEELGKQFTDLFLGKPITSDRIQEIKRQVILYFRDHHRPVVTVEVPEQDVSNGIVQVIVTEGRLDRVRVKNNEWFSTERLRDYVNLEVGDPIDSDTLLNDVAWMNRNPFRNSDIIFSPGSVEGFTDVELFTRDRIPIRPYVGGDNAGNDAIGNGRLFAGITWGNVFGWDHSLTYQYTTTSNFERLHAHSLQYWIPLPWKHELLLFGGWSKIDTEFIDARGKLLEGHSGQVSGRYTIPFKPLYTDFLRELSVGFDYKYTDNNFAFAAEDDTLRHSKRVNIMQFMGSFALTKMFKRVELEFEIDLYWSPGRLVGNQSKRCFESLRPHTDSTYLYGRINTKVTYRPKLGYSISMQVKGQAATDALLPSEQYGLGGYDTVRGYEEFAVTKDHAINTNLELRSPAIKVLRGARLDKVNDELIILGFFDYGIGWNIHPSDNYKRQDYLISIGPGIRYAINPYLFFRCDWGWRLHKLFSGQSRDRWHVGLLVSY